ncbi:MAG: sigma-54 dependent transcriptional regulator [Aliidongia sp.]
MNEDGFILVVEDSTAVLEMVARQLAALNFPVRGAGTLAEARSLLAGPVPAVAVLLDLRLPDGDGMALLRELRGGKTDPAVIVMTAHGSIDNAVDAMRDGADDFLVKPFAAARLQTTTRLAIDRRRLVRLVRTVSPGLSDDRFEGFIGADLSMQAVYRMIEQAARSKATVFITGESGTGKELCAEAIHRRSDRRSRRFVALNCGAIPKDLMESEIFGHVKGSFTGATADREGAAARADGGTLFLDEIGEMAPGLQVKLLRFLQTGAIQRVGSDRTATVDVRIVCATNRDPMAEVAAGRFREDLYYRLYVIPLHLPPLRERGGDIVKLARYFLTQFAEEEGRSFAGFAPEAEAVLAAYFWPGNVRELQNAIRNIVVLNDAERVGLEMIPPSIRGTAAGRRAEPGLSVAVARPAWDAGMPDTDALDIAVTSGDADAIRPLADCERDIIEAAIRACGGNMTEAAKRLGISSKTIYRKRQEWDETGAVP